MQYSVAPRIRKIDKQKFYQENFAEKSTLMLILNHQESLLVNRNCGCHTSLCMICVIVQQLEKNAGQYSY